VELTLSLEVRDSYIDDVVNHRPVHDLKLWEDFRYKIINSEFDEAEKLIERCRVRIKIKLWLIVKNGRE
jgi:hypothetical protein